eukprot:8087672-Ditylum_brightwellii.AAC.1
MDYLFMQLYVDSDAACLVMACTKNYIAGTFYCASKPNPHNYMTTPYDALILVERKALKNVICSVTEAEYGGLFHNSQMVMGIHNVLEAMGHTQGPIHVKKENKTANLFVYASMHIKCSKLWDMTQKNNILSKVYGQAR